MIHHPREALIGQQLKESFIDYDEDFPYVAYYSAFDRYAGRGVPWHWHDLFEFVVMRSGTLELCTPDGSCLVGPGQGYFVNTGVLHQCRAWKDRGGVVMHTQLFERVLIAGAGLIERRYVSPLVGCGALDVAVLEGEIIQVLERAFTAAGEEMPGYELAVSGCMMQAWQLLYRQAQPLLLQTAQAPRADTQRVKEMLRFIRQHYAEDIGVKEIAAAAGVCEREVFRCFRSVLDTTPLHSIIQQRVAEAARRLAETDQTVTQIAADCGFASPSYFGKVFRERMEMTPGAYREKSARGWKER